MIGHIGTFKLAPGKMPQVLEWTAKVVAYLKKASPGWQISLLQPITGDVNEIVFVGQGPSLSDFDEILNKRKSDPEWQALMKELRETDWNLGFTRTLYDVIE